MVHFHQLVLIIFFTILKESIQQISHNKDELLNWCLDSKSHKFKPGKEDSLHEQCLPWKNHACCTKETAVDLHETNMYNFTLDHCYVQTKRNMSNQCKKYFNQNNCFYECEPHIGLWVVKTSRKIATERFYKVPLCASDCDAWFQACKKDFTCARNWPIDFKYTQGHNTCSEGSQCTTFQNIYTTAKEFCETVWDQSWEYTPDTEPCMHIQFDPNEENPNRKTAEHYIDLRLGTGRASTAFLNMTLIVLGLFFSYNWNGYAL